MKRIDKKFLKASNLNLENQECYGREMPSVLRLYKSGHIRKLETKDIPFGGGIEYFLFYLSKKGLKRAKKLQKKKT